MREPIRTIELDKVDIVRSDIILANITKISAGSMMELLYAWTNGKLIVCVFPPGNGLSPWIRYHSHHIFSNLI